ncbi:GHKL domain-containing protein [Clostridiaceae bacterium M8S5]|nr:GHKL domain-containing protein [Clostridiaceae bacterium M8S5]
MGLINLFISKLLEKRIVEFQNDLISKHVDEVQNMYKQMRGWRHDYHNHIQTMKAHIEMGQIPELKQYLGKLDADLANVDTIIKTGNVMIDAILNSKISLAISKKIDVNAKAVVPKDIHISEIDLSVIIGNLLDNAMEACCALYCNDNPDRFPYIKIYIGVLKKQLYIYVSNSTSGNPKKISGKYISTKRSNNHGFGLMRIDNIINKYDGYINRQSEESVFVTEVLLPL